MSDVFATEEYAVSGDSQNASPVPPVTGGHVYDLEMNQTLDEVTLTEDGADKTTLPMVTTFIGTRTAWNILTPTQQAQYRRVSFTDDGNPTPTMLSYIGMVIHSTTLNSEAMVKQIYGADTSWILHDGYVLRGSSSGVLADNAVKDGGEDTVTLTIQQMPSHSHQEYYTWSSAGSVGGNWKTQMVNTGNGGAGAWPHTSGLSTDVSLTGGGQPHNNMQSYKNVFIWERVS